MSTLFFFLFGLVFFKRKRAEQKKNYRVLQVVHCGIIAHFWISFISPVTAVNREEGSGVKGGEEGSGVKEEGSGVNGGEEGIGVNGGEEGIGVNGGEEGSGVNGGEEGIGVKDGEEGSGVNGGEEGSGVKGVLEETNVKGGEEGSGVKKGEEGSGRTDGEEGSGVKGGENANRVDEETVGNLGELTPNFKDDIDFGDKKIDEAHLVNVRRLSEWSIQICVRKLKNGYGFCVEGKNRHGQIWHSSAITGRVLCADGPQRRRVISINNRIYDLEGPIDKQLSISSGVASEIVNRFNDGFPDDWVDLMTTASKAYNKANPMTSNHSQVLADTKPDDNDNPAAARRNVVKEGEEKQNGKRKPKDQTLTKGQQKRGEADSQEGKKRRRIEQGDDLCPVQSDETNEVFYALAFISFFMRVSSASFAMVESRRMAQVINIFASSATAPFIRSAQRKQTLNWM